MRKNRGIFLFLAWLGMVVYFTQRWIYGPVIPALMVAFEVDKADIGVIGSASLWGYMVSPIIAGLLSDRFGRKHVILFGIFGFSLLTVLCGLVSSPAQLFAGRFFTGAVEAYFFVPLLAYTLEVFPERPGFYLTLMSSGSSLGWFTGPALAGWLMDLTGKWQLPFLTTGLIGLAVAALLAIFWPDAEKVHRVGPILDRTALKAGNIILLVFLSLIFAFQISAEFGFTMWYPAFLELERGLPTAAAGAIAGLFGLGQFFGRPAIGWFSDRISYRLVGMGSGIIMSVSLVLVLSVESELQRGFFTLQAGFIGAGVMGVLWTFTGLVFPSFKGLALGIITTLGYALGSLAPILIGYLGDHYSVGMGLWSVCVPAAFLAAFTFLITFLVRPSLRTGALKADC